MTPAERRALLREDAEEQKWAPIVRRVATLPMR